MSTTTGTGLCAGSDRGRMLAAIRDGVTRDDGEEMMKSYGEELSEADRVRLLDDIANNEFGQ